MANLAVASKSAVSGGAVPTLAIARSNIARRMCKICANPPLHSVQLKRCLRSSRLCVLMNPCPAGLEIHPDLAGYRVLPTWKNALLTLKIFSCGPDSSGERKRANLSNIVRAQMSQDAQFTNRRIRTFIATPSARKVNNTEDPP